ncbi:MAG: hypothetical protein ACK5QT_10905 [Oligoflexia bacterium]
MSRCRVWTFLFRLSLCLFSVASPHALGSVPREDEWRDVPSSLESPHPYPNRANLLFEASVPGARWMRVVFSKIETEFFYDKITIENPGGHVFDSFTGFPKNLVSLPVPGEVLMIRLRSDRTTRGYGFSVAKLQYSL